MTEASRYGLHIFPQHAEVLAASAIDPAVARERGYVSVDTLATIRKLKFVKAARVPGLLIPIHGSDGERRLHQYRPDAPRLDSRGKECKYETPWRAHICLDVPPRARGQLAEQETPLWLTEGARKADAAVSAGLCCIALIGVDGWMSHGVALPDWREILLPGRTVYVAFDSDVMVKPEVSKALKRLTTWLGWRGATVRHVLLPAGDDGAKTGLDDYLGAGHTVDDLLDLACEPPAGYTSATTATSVTSAGQLVADSGPVALASAFDGDLDGLLSRAHKFLGQFIVYPSSHAQVAHALWVAHTHAMHAWESTPRIAFLSPEPGSGKTRALEVTELLTPRPVEAVNTTPAYLFRKVSDPKGLPTVLYDEVDTLFGPRAKDNEEIRGMLNAGHRRGAVAGRCVTRGDVVETEELPAYCPVALAGLHNLPDTLFTRSVIIRMKRRARGEEVVPYRRRVHKDEGHGLRDELAGWGADYKLGDAWPLMPPGIADRDADVWEALLAVADAAGGDWPQLARVAAVALVADAKAAVGQSIGIRLLSDLQRIFGDDDEISTKDILEALNNLDDAPWGDLRGKPLDSRRISRMLREYEVGPANVRTGPPGLDGYPTVVKGYKREDLHDAWERYLPPDTRPRCAKCGKLLDQALVDAGLTDHGEEDE